MSTTDDRIELTCTKCKHIWYPSMEELERVHVVFRGVEADPKEPVEYRVQCPVCGTYNIVGIIEE